jgi:phage-related protein
MADELDAGPIFNWCVTGATYDLEPSVTKAQFGDGYAQRKPSGINTQSRVWTVDMKNITTSMRDDVLAFLEARNGVEVFNWTAPRFTTALDYVCPSWSFSYGDMTEDGSYLYNLSMKFQQVYV